MTDKQLLEQALKRAFQLGQNYWSWADSEYSSHWKKADAAKAEFDKLVEDTIYTTPPQRTEQGAVIDHSCKDTYELIMKWADIYAAQTGELYSQAARDPSRAAKMADERTMLACVVAQAFPNPAAPVQEPDYNICPTCGGMASDPIVPPEQRQPAPVQEPVAFKIYKPTPPQGAIPNVRDAELPWVYDQDPSSGNVASMWVTPVQALRSKNNG
jgi:hypothetical protein